MRWENDGVFCLSFWIFSCKVRREGEGECEGVSQCECECECECVVKTCMCLQVKKKEEVGLISVGVIFGGEECLEWKMESIDKE